MNILVTGANGFIGKNLIAELRNRGYTNIFKMTRETDDQLLEKYTKECDFVFHLAGVNRPEKEDEFLEGNYELTSKLVDLLKKHNNTAPILFTSSIQAEKDNPYGVSKKTAEELLLSYHLETDTKVYIYRLTNVFGKWSKPNYNSVVATFCHRISRNLEIQIHQPDATLKLCYIDDVIEEFIKTLKEYSTKIAGYRIVSEIHSIKLGDLAELIKSFKDSRTELLIPNMENRLTKNLYSTYLSFLPDNELSYDLKMHKDQRGSFTEFIRTADRGQVSINVSKPGIAKGNHWHHTKNEKFLVVSGKGIIRLRKIDSPSIIEYQVSGEKLEVIDIPIGYTHSIINVGDSDMVTVMWVNECFDKEKPDTYFLEV
ncbi:polysaccharide biosynthesis C-terminal domain-containing protein [Rummeliibacillus sp. JY-2-4R]